MNARPRRSVLYMPGSNVRALEKAKTLPVDGVILDLEDSVAPEAKEDARQKVTDAVKSGGFGAREVFIRVNGVETPWHADDLSAAAHAAPDAILVPKVSSPDTLELIGRRLLDMGTHHSTNDLAKDTRARLVPGRTPMLSWLSTCVAAARIYGIDILDGVYNDIGNADGFAKECAQGVELGFDGKTLIHPSQIEPCNKVFSPSQAEVEQARKMIAAFDLPENKGKGVVSIDGRMVERLHADMARRTVAIAAAIEQRN